MKMIRKLTKLRKKIKKKKLRKPTKLKTKMKLKRKKRMLNQLDVVVLVVGDYFIYFI
jgi:hypothetical protein